MVYHSHNSHDPIASNYTFFRDFLFIKKVYNSLNKTTNIIHKNIDWWILKTLVWLQLIKWIRKSQFLIPSVEFVYYLDNFAHFENKGFTDN